ncbi:hypothetical protein ASF70_01445 [Rhizobium sp. Leaf321]|nr:hypothetical protein ASF70_01445 [Rhizobium sp. Leaf321]
MYTLATEIEGSDRSSSELKAAANESVEEGAETDKSQMKKNDLAFDEQGNVVDSITRFSYALSEMTGRKGIRDEISRYEAMTLVMIEPLEGNGARKFAGFPEERLQLQLKDFFNDLYLRYNERFVIGAPALTAQTNRLFWNEKSPALRELTSVVGNELEYELRTP